jgi:hypothetical protein
MNHTSSSLNITNVQLINSGDYLVQVSYCGGSIDSQVATLAVTPNNTSPIISDIRDLIIREDTPTEPIAFTVSDAETQSKDLKVVAKSSNQIVVPDSNISRGDSGANRTLILTPAPDQFGTTTISDVVTDGDGAAATNFFLLTVIPVNDSPTLGPIGNLTINEDAALQTLDLTGIGTGAPNEFQALTVSAKSDNPSVIPDPAVTYISPAANGSLRLQPLPNAFGQARITVSVRDDGGTESGGQDTFVRSFIVTVNPVNDPPSFIKGPDLTATNTAGPQSRTGWATNIRAGPANEADQALTFLLSADMTNLFATPPAISPIGELKFTPAPNTTGTAIVAVVLRDSGGTANGGMDSSEPQVFHITIVDGNKPPTISITNPLDGATNTPGINLLIETAANDPDGTIALVEFFAGTEKLGEASIPPFAYLWENIPKGVYRLIARATDNSGATTTSAPVTVTNLPPPPCLGDVRVGVSFTDWPSTVAVGSNVTLKVNIRMAHDPCDVFGVVAMVELPSALRFVNAYPTSAWRETNGVVTFLLGQIPRATDTNLVVVALAEWPGPQTNNATVSWNGSLQPQRAPEAVIIVSGCRLGIRVDDDGAAEISLMADANHIYDIQVSTNFVNWSAINPDPIPGPTGTFVDPNSKFSGPRFYRARQW